MVPIYITEYADKILLTKKHSEEYMELKTASFSNVDFLKLLREATELAMYIKNLKKS